MLAALTTLLLCQLVGEATVRALDWPVPGPVLGMILLFVLMATRAPLPKETGDTAAGLLGHLSLLFVPAGVGVVREIGTLGSIGLRLMAVIVLGTVIALAVTALTFAGVARLMGTDSLEPVKDDGPEQPV
jgi:putative effector of murein hydrolase LrgA (UPF0299 family)